MTNKIENMTLEDIYDDDCAKNIKEHGDGITFALHIAGEYYKPGNQNIMYLSSDTIIKIINDVRKLTD